MSEYDHMDWFQRAVFYWMPGTILYGCLLLMLLVLLSMIPGIPWHGAFR